MRRTRLFHTVVIVGSSLLANCDRGQAPAKPKDASVKKDAAPNVPIIDAPAPAKIVAQIDAGAVPPPVRIMVAPPPARIMPKPPPPAQIMPAPKPRIMAPHPVRIMAAPMPRIMR